MSTAPRSVRAKISYYGRIVKTLQSQVDSLSMTCDSNDPDLVEARTKLWDAQLSEHVARHVSTWAPLTPEEIAAIVPILRSASRVP